MSHLDGHLRQRRGVDDALAQVGELALGQVAVAAEGEVGDHPAEHGVAEELEPLVGGLPAHLRAPRPVRHRPAQQGDLGELVAELSLARQATARDPPGRRTGGQAPCTGP